MQVPRPSKRVTDNRPVRVNVLPIVHAQVHMPVDVIADAHASGGVAHVQNVRDSRLDRVDLLRNPRHDVDADVKPG